MILLLMQVYYTVIQLLWLPRYLLYSVLIIVDTSTPVASHIIRLQEDLKLLIQQQLPLVDSFNMIRCVNHRYQSCLLLL